MNNFIKIVILIFLQFNYAFAVTKTSTGNGNWATSGTWSPSGVPTSSDDVIIAHNVTMNANPGAAKSVTINTGKTLTISNNRNLTISGTAGLTVNGSLDMSGGDLTLSTSGAAFTLNSNSTFTFDPATTTIAGATIFTNGAENFSSSSTLIMKSWYNYTVGLGSVITGNFGNLTIQDMGTWKMNNTLQSHQVQGALTIDNSYVILDTTGTISNTSIGSIVLLNSTSYLDFYDGTHPGSFTVNVTSITITDGELDCFYTSGTGNCTLNVSGNMTLTTKGTFKGTNNHNGNVTINISGNLDLTKSYFYGVETGSGNATVTIGGNLTLTKGGATYSEMYGIVDGNGNANITVTGNYSNQGYFDLIWNSGVTGVGNGNGTLTVGGTFTQSEGDFRGIWNLTTTNAGMCNLTINNINFTGGVFMVYYACKATAVTNSLTVNGNLSIAFSAASDVFRGNGLGVLSSTNSLAAFNMTVSGTTSISGNNSAEFATSVAYGSESLTTVGNITLSGGTNRFQYGNHNFTWNHSGNITISGGTNYLSAEAGNATVNISGNLSISGGTLATKIKSGTGTVNIGGTYTQSNGTFYLYYNSTTSASDNITVNVANDFSQTGGTLTFSNNTGSTGIYSLNLSGDDYTIGGTADINSTGTGTLFGFLNFNRNGTTNFNRTTTTHDVQQVKQTVKNGTTFYLNTGNLQVASSTTPGTDYLTVENGGVLNANTKQILSNGTLANSGINAASGASIITSNTNGFYNGSTTATLSSTGNMNYSLDANSIVEYNGTDNQIVTGMGSGVATQTQHKYGKLKINFSGTANVEYAYLSAANTNVRTQLILTAGELNLNNKMLIVEDGSPGAITRTAGYVKSETNNAINNSILKWMNMQTGLHVFPFGVNSTNYIPVSITPSSGIGGYVEISTRATGSNNTPLTGLSNVAAVTNLNRQGSDVSTGNVIDRWWVINAPGFAADVTLSYSGSENSTSAGNNTGQFNIQAWDGTKWGSPFGSGTGVTSGIGTVTASGVTTFNPFVLVSSNGALPIKLLSFEAKNAGDQVNINWSTAEEKNNDFFTVERSIDGKSFEEVNRVKGAGNSSLIKSYTSADQHPFSGKSYYRVKQTDFDGKFTYSPIRVVDRSNSSKGLAKPGAELLTIGPNPFYDQFSMTYSRQEEGETHILLYSANGQLIFDNVKNDNQGINNFDFTDQYNLPPGNYILNVICGKEKITRKLVKTVN